MRAKLKSLVSNSFLERPARYFWQKFLGEGRLEFNHSAQYWQDRYKREGNSGAGSYGRLAEFKAEVLNKFVQENTINSVLELGCGDGNQLELSTYPKYLGVDVAHQAVELCREKFKADKSKEFIHSSEYTDQNAELTLSLDVIYHLIEDDVFEEYMGRLFDAAQRFVIIYSCDFIDNSFEAPHVKPRKFTDWVRRERSDFQLFSTIKNRYPWDGDKSAKDSSFSDFFVYERVD